MTQLLAERQQTEQASLTSPLIRFAVGLHWAMLVIRCIPHILRVIFYSAGLLHSPLAHHTHFHTSLLQPTLLLAHLPSYQHSTRRMARHVLPRFSLMQHFLAELMEAAT